MVDILEDRLIWKETKDAVYSNKSMYKALRLRVLESFPWDMIWKSRVQSKMCFFAWEAL